MATPQRASMAPSRTFGNPLVAWVRRLSDPLASANHAARWIGELPGGARAVFDDGVVACGAKLFTDLASHHIHSAPGRVAHQDFQGLALREGEAGREACASAGSEVGQAVAASNHDDPF